MLLACIEGEHVLVTSPTLIAEALRVLRDKFDTSPEDTAAFLAVIERNAAVISPTKRLSVIAADPADDRVLECAIEGRAAIIATGDRHLLVLGTFRSTEILRPAEALRRLGD